MSIRVGIITLSDRSASGERSDVSGPAQVTSITSQGWQVVRTELLPDDFNQLVAALSHRADGDEMDLILTTGGTGLAHET
jgi:molybdopterin biosynthesis enzyme MoaB